LTEVFRLIPKKNEAIDCLKMQFIITDINDLRLATYLALPNPPKKHIQAPLDLLETPTHFLLTLDLPGFQKDEVNMRVQDGLLVICGTRQEGEGENTYAERGFGSFFRQIRLPGSDMGGISAWLENGVLEVKVGKDLERKGEDLGLLVPLRDFPLRLASGTKKTSSN
jgi:HSP20 family molecular chaperone IbpA